MEALLAALGAPPGTARFPVEIAAWFTTLEKADADAKRDAFAADLIELCRILALPKAKQGEATIEWWCRSQGEHADDARRVWAEMAPKDRDRIVAGWFDDLPAHVGTHLYVAWCWHAETAHPKPVKWMIVPGALEPILTADPAPVRPSLVVATACALKLVNWSDDGRPSPKRAIRASLDLPTENDLPELLAAARIKGEAARRGEMLKPAALAKLVGVGEGSIGNWSQHFPKYAGSADDLFFPWGLPDDPTITPETIEAECAIIAKELAQARRDRTAKKGRKGRDAKALPVEPRARLFQFALQLARNEWHVPDSFLHALAHALELASTDKDKLVLSPDVARGLGLALPVEPENVAHCRLLARLDADAVKRRVQPETIGERVDAIVSNLGRAIPLPHAEFAEAVMLVKAGLVKGDDGIIRDRNGKAVKVEFDGERTVWLSGREDEAIELVALDTMKEWRRTREYRRLVRDIVISGSMVERAFRQWGYRRAEPLRHEQTPIPA